MDRTRFPDRRTVLETELGAFDTCDPALAAKHAKMRASPFRVFRGAAPAFHADLTAGRTEARDRMLHLP